jgi:ceramide glucosyltransferase
MGATLSLLSLVTLGAAGLGLVLAWLQVVVLRAHLSSRRPEPGALPEMSILKPLCGVDDDLERNLELFAHLDHPRYEVLLGVRSRSDPAWPAAVAIAKRWPARFRVILQQGEPGLNPKVNQLIALARAARHELLVVSDSNVRVSRDYLREIAAHLASKEVGLVTHPIAGVGERSLGALFDNLHLAGNITPGMVAAQRIAGRDVVVGKSMALRRADLRALGGFECVKDVLAEDYVLGVKVACELRKKVVVAKLCIENVNRERAVGEFLARYTRWCIMQRKILGPLAYGVLGLLNPVAVASLGAALAPDHCSLALLAFVCLTKASLDGAAARSLRSRGFAWRQLALIPVKDLLVALAWAQGFALSSVAWRGNRLRVLQGSRLERPANEEAKEALATDP